MTPELPRRSFLAGLGSSLIAAPAIVSAISLMPVKVMVPQAIHLYGTPLFETISLDDVMAAVFELQEQQLAEHVARNNALLRRLYRDCELMGSA